MANHALTNTQGVMVDTSPTLEQPSGWQGIVADWSSDQRAFKNVVVGKAMMWIFLLERYLHLQLFPAART